jgi:paraquat-inducible protein B
LLQTLDGLAGNTNTVIQGISDDIIQVAAGANNVVQNMEVILENLSNQIIPVTGEIKSVTEAAQTAIEQANKAFVALENITRRETLTGYQIHNAFDEFAAAARSIRLLADYLERHPEALIHGKRDQR